MSIHSNCVCTYHRDLDSSKIFFIPLTTSFGADQPQSPLIYLTATVLYVPACDVTYILIHSNYRGGTRNTCIISFNGR